MTSQCWIMNLFSSKCDSKLFCLQNIDLSWIKPPHGLLFYESISAYALRNHKLFQCSMPTFPNVIAPKAIEIIAVYKLANDDEPLGLQACLYKWIRIRIQILISAATDTRTLTHRSNEIYAYKGMRRIDLRNFNLVASLVKFPNISAIALLLSIVCGVCARSTFLPLLHRFADCCVCNLVLSIAYLPGNYCAINAGLRKFLIAF